VCRAAAQLLLTAGRAAIDRYLLSDGHAAAKPQHGTQQQMRAVSRCQRTYEAKRRLILHWQMMDPFVVVF